MKVQGTGELHYIIENTYNRTRDKRRYIIMGFFSDLKEDLSQAVNELMPEEDLNQGDVAET